MSDINHETGESLQGRSPRFTLWVAFLVFATITLGSSVEVKNNLVDPNSAAKWAVACSGVTFGVTALVVLAHLFPVASTLIVGTRTEGITILILACFWAATVAIVTNASNGLSVANDANNQILNGNLYYFSWAGFVTAIVLLVNYGKTAFGVDVVGQVKNRATRLSIWAALLASSLVVMGSSVRVLNDSCGTEAENDTPFCRRTKFGISSGTIGVFIAVAIVAMKMFTTTAPFIVEFAMSIILAVLNAFGVAYITSPSGPGSPIGNLYYFSWIAFLCSALLVADCFNQYSGSSAAAASPDANFKHDSEIEVENLEDKI